MSSTNARLRGNPQDGAARARSSPRSHAERSNAASACAHARSTSTATSNTATAKPASPTPITKGEAQSIDLTWPEGAHRFLDADPGRSQLRVGDQPDAGMGIHPSVTVGQPARKSRSASRGNPSAYPLDGRRTNWCSSTGATSTRRSRFRSRFPPAATFSTSRSTRNSSSTPQPKSTTA